jgi:hypothetical protein
MPGLGHLLSRIATLIESFQESGIWNQELCDAQDMHRILHRVNQRIKKGCLFYQQYEKLDAL